MIRELDRVKLSADLPEHGLKSGDVGTVVLAHDSQDFEVEFITLDGEPLVVVSLFPNQLQPSHARGKVLQFPSQCHNGNAGGKS